MGGAGHAAWVAVRPDLCSLTDAAELRKHFRLYVWEALASEGQAAVDRFQAAAYIAQAETTAELLTADGLAPSIRVPKALIGGQVGWLPGWTPLLECYMVSVPADLGGGFPVLGVFDGFPLANYAASLAGRRDFSVYLAEGMTEADWQAFGV